MVYGHNQILRKGNKNKFILFGVALVFAVTLVLSVRTSANAIGTYNGAVTITPGVSGFTTSSTNDTLDAEFTINPTTYDDTTTANITTFSGMVDFTDPVNSCSFDATINANGYDTFFFEIYDCSPAVSGYTYLVGEYASLEDIFYGTFINKTSAMVPTEDITITGDSTVEVGQTETYNTTIAPVDASGEVRWSVWSNPCLLYTSPSP